MISILHILLLALAAYDAQAMRISDDGSALLATHSSQGSAPATAPPPELDLEGFGSTVDDTYERTFCTDAATETGKVVDAMTPEKWKFLKVKDPAKWKNGIAIVSSLASITASVGSLLILAGPLTAPVGVALFAVGLSLKVMTGVVGAFVSEKEPTKHYGLDDLGRLIENGTNVKLDRIQKGIESLQAGIDDLQEKMDEMLKTQTDILVRMTVEEEDGFFALVGTTHKAFLNYLDMDSKAKVAPTSAKAVQENNAQLHLYMQRQMPLIIHDMDKVFSIDRPWKDTLETFEKMQETNKGIVTARDMAVTRTMATITARSQAFQLVAYYYLDVLNDEAMGLLQLEAYKEDMEILDGMLKSLLVRFEEGKAANKLEKLAMDNTGAASFREAWQKAAETKAEIRRQEQALAAAPASSPPCEQTCTNANTAKDVIMPNVTFNISKNRIETKDITFVFTPTAATGQAPGSTSTRDSGPKCITDCVVKVGRRGIFTKTPTCDANEKKFKTRHVEKVTDRLVEFNVKLCCATVKACTPGGR